MTRISELLDLQVPGVDNITWDSRLHDLAHEYCPDDIYRRHGSHDLTLFGLGPCSRREAVIGRSRRCFEHDVVTHLNFCHGRLCAVHQFFQSVTAMDEHDYYAALDSIRRRLVRSLGAPSLATHVQTPSQASYRWRLDGMHAELRSCDGRTHRDLSLAINNPSECSWCMYWR